MHHGGSFLPKSSVITKNRPQVLIRSYGVNYLVALLNAVQIAEILDVTGQAGWLILLYKLNLYGFGFFGEIIARVFVGNQILVLGPKIFVSTLALYTPANNANFHPQASLDLTRSATCLGVISALTTKPSMPSL